MGEGADELDARVLAGRAKHGVGLSEDFPGNVCHLVSPIVGHLRRRQRDGAAIPDLGHIIDRLSFVLDMARQEAERNRATPAAQPAPSGAAAGSGPACTDPDCPIYARHPARRQTFPPHGPHDFRAGAQ